MADTKNHRIRKISTSCFVSTLAGSGTNSLVDGTGTGSSFSFPKGITVDGLGNVYIGDFSNNAIRKITPLGVVTTLAGGVLLPGSINGTGSGASFNGPTGLAVDSLGNVYVADYFNHKIRKITSSGVVTTFAGSGAQGYLNGIGTAADFNYPTGVAVDDSGNVFVADYGNDVIRKISPTGIVTTLAGSNTQGSANGTGIATSFNKPYGITIDQLGNVYVGEQGNRLIRKITYSGVVTTLAGGTSSPIYKDGNGTSAGFDFPAGIAIDSSGDEMYVPDVANSLIRKIKITNIITVTEPALPTTKGNLYPNPSKDEVYIQLPEEMRNQLVYYSIIYDASGRPVYNYSYEGISEVVKLNIAGLGKGLYQVYIISGNYNMSEKLIVEK